MTKSLGRGDEISRRFISEVKNTWSQMSIPSNVFMAADATDAPQP
jgi:hypothetical protein